jgi:hypothetical protein
MCSKILAKIGHSRETIISVPEQQTDRESQMLLGVPMITYIFKPPFIIPILDIRIKYH